MKPLVHILACGGTISAAGESGKTTGYRVGSLGIEALIGGIPGIADVAAVRAEQFYNLSSDDMGPAHWLAIAKRVNALAADPAISGIVLTHGTNTLEETAFFLNLTCKTHKPIVITGSMRPATALSADGAMNLYQAIALAVSPEARGQGVLLLFGDGIYGARDGEKVNGFRAQAFGGNDYGCLGVMQDQTPYFLNASRKPHTLSTEFDVTTVAELPRVDIAWFYAGAPVEPLTAVRDAVQGLVLAGAGNGFCGELWRQELRRYAAAGIPVVRTARVANRLVSHDDIDDECSTLTAATLSPQKARILLSLALLHTHERALLQGMLNRY